MQKNSKETAKQVQRLCNEIKLFDLCDLEQCGYKNGRFCCNEELLASFELISEDDSRLPPDQYLDEELDEGEGSDETFDDAFGEDNFEDEVDDREKD